MLSSRTEMQKVIETARNQSLAAFMQTPPPAPTVAMPAAVPPIVPAAVPEIKKSASKEKESKSDKRDKRRSRSRSRDRKERSRDRDRRDRRHRDRSRSRSRDRRDRRRHDRSRSRDRTRSRDRDRKPKDYNRGPIMSIKDPKPVVWEAPPKTEQVELPKAAGLLGSFVPNMTLEEARRNLNALTVPAALALATAASANVTTANNDSSFHNQNIFERVRDSWPPNGRQNNPPQSQLNFTSPNSDDFQNNDDSNSCHSFSNQNQNVATGNFNNQQLNDRGFNRNMPPRGPNNRFNQGSGRNALELQTNCCVQIEPLFGAYSDVRRFFQGLFISNTGIKYVTDDYGKRTGIVYVRFAYPEGKEQALLRNGAPFRNNPVKVSHIDDEIFDNYIPGERYNPEPFSNNGDENENPFKNRNINKTFNRNTSSQQLPPLPASFSALVVEDLPTYAKEQDILKMFSDYSLNSIMMKKVRQNHMAYVKFNNPDDAKKAFMEKVKHSVDGKPVTVKPCKDEEYEEFDAQQNKIEIEPEKKLIDTDCIVLNNLPLKTNDRDISDFFSDVGIIPTKIHLMSNHLGFTGTVYCEFNTFEESTTALEKEGVQLGTNVISVKPIPRKEMQSMLGITIPGNQPPIHPSLMQQPNHRPHFMPRNNNYNMRPNFMGGPRPIRRFHPPPVQQQTNDPPGCTVLMENVPYKAGLDEILEFFDGFDIRTDSVLRRFNDNGTPSGEAKVFFNNPDDAFQAVQQKRGCTIRDRTIYLTLC